MRFFVFFVFLTICTPIFAAEQPSNYFGININYNSFYHQSDFKSLPGIPNCCPIFDKGYGSDFNYNIYYDYYFNDYWFIKTSVNYLGIYGYFTSIEQELLGSEGQIISGEFEHRIKANLNLITINPSINFHWNNISFGLGLGFGEFLKKSFSQEEVITKPANAGTFLDSLGNDSGSRVRNSRSGNLPINNHIQFSTFSNISYDLPLNAEETVKLVPNISFEYFINNISNEMNWRAYSISGGLALSFALDKPDKYNLKQINEDSLNLMKPIISSSQNDSLNTDWIYKNMLFNAEKIELPGIFISQNKEMDSSINDNKSKLGEVVFEYDTIVVTTKTKIRKTKYRFDTLTYSSKEPVFFKFGVKAIGDDGKQKDFDKFRFEQIKVERSLPLLNYLFYKDNEIDFSNNFTILNRAEAGKFDLGMLHINNDIEVYDNLLNIIASRMKSNHEEKLQIRAFIGADSDKNSTVPNKRAEKIKSYFTDIFGISSDRIEINQENINLQKANETSGRDIADELRRVELIGSDILLEPYYFIDTAIYSNPEIIKISAENKTNSKIKNYSIKAYIDSAESIIDIINKSSEIKSEEFNMSDYQQFIKDSINFIKFDLTVKSNDDNKFESEIIKRADFNSLSKKNLLNQKEPKYMKYNLILFDYNSYNINQTNRQIINKIKKIINAESEVEITGFSDELGNQNYNNQLSYLRAKAVADLLKTGNIKIKGAGSLSKHTLRKTPESRFYERVVEVFIINK
jgi:outer membrane protein OmpA-like peptidoglycan-associated protein